MRQTYTANEVRALLYTAYIHGRHEADINELQAIWAEKREPRLTRERRVAARIAEMEAAAARINAELGRPPGYEYRGGPVVWATGAPLVELGVAA
jgi:hypothetical protein